MSDKKMEIVYYQLVEMEDRLTKKAEVILEARDEINTSLARFEILAKKLLSQMEEAKL
ncbi:MAG: hypothetical protein Q9M36_02765 [Sulfurovum sp.]|nr:hypothetical protein [Sulfurovum sp.]